MTLRFALTTGEPSGIGPDLAVMLAHEVQPYPVIAISNQEMLSQRAAQLGLKIKLIDVQPDAWPDKPAPADSFMCGILPLRACRGRPIESSQCSIRFRNPDPRRTRLSRWRV